MRLLVREFIVQLARDRLRLGNFFRLQAITFQHVQEIGVAAEIELVSAIHTHATLAKKIRENAMSDGRADLGFYVVADNREPARLKSLLPVRL